MAATASASFGVASSPSWSGSSIATEVPSPVRCPIRMFGIDPSGAGTATGRTTDGEYCRPVGHLRIRARLPVLSRHDGGRAGDRNASGRVPPCRRPHSGRAQRPSAGRRADPHAAHRVSSPSVCGFRACRWAAAGDGGFRAGCRQRRRAPSAVSGHGQLGAGDRRWVPEPHDGYTWSHPSSPSAWPRPAGFPASKRLEQSFKQMGFRQSHRTAQTSWSAAWGDCGGAGEGMGGGRVVRGVGLQARRVAGTDIRGGLPEPVSHRGPPGRPFPRHFIRTRGAAGPCAANCCTPW